MLSPADIYRTNFERRFNRLIVPAGASDAEAVRLAEQAASAAHSEACAAVAATMLADARDLEERRAHATQDAAGRQRLAAAADAHARKRLKKVPGGDGVDLDGRYELLTHSAGRVACTFDDDEHRAGWPPIIRGVRATARVAAGRDLAGVEDLAAVVDGRGEARAALIDIAAARPSRARTLDEAGEPALG